MSVYKHTVPYTEAIVPKVTTSTDQPVSSPMERLHPGLTLKELNIFPLQYSNSQDMDAPAATSIWITLWLHLL